MSNEHNEQAGFVLWWRQKFPTVVIFAIPNGSWRDISTARKLKMEGVTRGVPDLYIPALHCWIEIKTETGRLSGEQIEMHRYLRAVGDEVIVGYGATDASEKILKVVKKNEV